MPSDRAVGAFDAQNHRLGHAVQGQVAGHRQAAAAPGHAGAGKGGRRELRHVEEIRALEVVVRASSPVSTRATSMVAVTVDLVMSASFSTMVAATLPKRPCTLETLMCLMLKSTSLWAGSEVQVEVCARARGAASARMPVSNCQTLHLHNSFRCGPLGRLGLGKSRSLSPDARRDGEKLECAAPNSSLPSRMP